MNINDFRKLEKKLNNQNFGQNYKAVNIMMAILSYFGNLASIFLAYFMLSKVLAGAMSDSPIAVFFASIIILTGLELLKRDIFDKFSVQYLKVKSFNKSVIPLFILSMSLISVSFYSSINGAKEFSSKSVQIEEVKNENIKLYEDSLISLYGEKISDIESEISNYKIKIDEKDDEQSLINQSLQDKGYLGRSERQRNKQLTEEKKYLDKKVSESEIRISSIEDRRNLEILTYEKEVTEETNSKKEDNTKNSFMFVIISTIIEFVILSGVFFNEYYKFRSYREFREKIDRDPNFQKWMLYDRLLSIIYTEDTKISQKLPPTKSIVDLCKLNDVIILQKDMMDFLKTMKSLGIIKTSGSSRFFNKQRDISFEVLKKNFNID